MKSDNLKSISDDSIADLMDAIFGPEPPEAANDNSPPIASGYSSVLISTGYRYTIVLDLDEVADVIAATLDDDGYFVGLPALEGRIPGGRETTVWINPAHIISIEPVGGGKTVN